MDKNISIIVPCKNEEKYIAICIEALLQQEIFELIVVDNGSTDATLDILARFESDKRVKILNYTDGGISAVRNFAVNLASSEWLGFIDSDVEVLGDWLDTAWRHIQEQLETEDANFILGATYGVRSDPSWIESSWFVQMSNRDREGGNYINGGNMVMTRALFDQVGGFNTTYQTGEDVKLCKDAMEAGARIIKTPDLKTIHHGYPRTLGGFFRRERWHGAGMVRSLSRPWKARDLMLGMYFLSILVAIIPFCVAMGVTNAVLLSFILLLSPCALIAAVRSRGHGLAECARQSVLWFVYAAAKANATFTILRKQLLSR